MDNLGKSVSSIIERAYRLEEVGDEELENFALDCAAYDREVDQAKAALLKLAGLMPAPGSEQDPETLAAVYWNILKTELSPSYIAAVCWTAQRGEIGEGRFLPLPGQLISYGRTWFQGRETVRQDPRIAGPGVEQPRVRYAAPEHRPVLGYSPQKLSEDERKRIADKVRAEMHRVNDALRAEDRQAFKPPGLPVISRKELASMDAGEREKHRIEAEIALEKLKSGPLPKLSGEALAIFKRPTAEAAE